MCEIGRGSALLGELLQGELRGSPERHGNPGAVGQRPVQGEVKASGGALAPLDGGANAKVLRGSGNTTQGMVSRHCTVGIAPKMINLYNKHALFYVFPTLLELCLRSGRDGGCENGS